MLILLKLYYGIHYLKYFIRLANDLDALNIFLNKYFD